VCASLCVLWVSYGSGIPMAHVCLCMWQYVYDYRTDGLAQHNNLHKEPKQTVLKKQWSHMYTSQ